MLKSVDVPKVAKLVDIQVVSVVDVLSKSQPVLYDELEVVVPVPGSSEAPAHRKGLCRSQGSRPFWHATGEMDRMMEAQWKTFMEVIKAVAFGDK